jgi:hypothetical protein
MNKRQCHVNGPQLIKTRRAISVFLSASIRVDEKILDYINQL